MILPGRLRVTTLGDVLGTLHRARVWGELELIGHDPPRRGSRHSILLRDGLVTDVRTSLPTPPIGEVLLGSGRLTRRQHEQFLRTLSLSRGPAGEVLVRHGWVTPEDLVAGLAHQTRLRLDALYAMHDADVRFHPTTTAWNTSPRLEPSQFLHGRPRARDARRSAPSDGAYEQALEVLGLTAGASRQQVRRAFRRLAATSHPDLHPHASVEARAALESRFAELSQAYHFVITHGT